MKNRTRWFGFANAVALTLAVSSGAVASDGGKSVFTSKADVKWTEAGIPGVSTAAVQGDMAKGPSHFYLKYAAGFVSPLHHHTPDHYVTTLSGNLVLIVAGKKHSLAPGSYFAFTGKAAHVARCEGAEDCVMFIDARDTWDVVPEASPDPKHPKH